MRAKGQEQPTVNRLEERGTKQGKVLDDLPLKDKTKLKGDQ